MANLRIVYDNAANRASVTASSTAGSLVASNLLTDIKSEVWRSTTTSATITLTWTEGEFLSMVALPFCNLTSAATVRVRAYATASDTIPILDTGEVFAASAPEFESFEWGNALLGANAYAYGGGTYGVVWFEEVVAKKLVIDIADTLNPSGYIEAARLVTGEYWSPVNNADYGLSVNAVDNSRHERSDAGDLRVERGVMFKSLSLELQYMPASDRNAMWNILRGNGMYKPVFLSVCPQSEDEFEEQIFQIYGRLSRSGSMRYQFVNQFSTQLEIEEI